MNIIIIIIIITGSKLMSIQTSSMIFWSVCSALKLMARPYHLRRPQNTKLFSINVEVAAHWKAVINMINI